MNFLLCRLFYLRATFLAVLLSLAATAHANTMVRLHTNFGPIDMTLLDAEAPRTVINFLAYVRGFDYNNNFVHRSAWLTGTSTPFVIQGGGYNWTPAGDIVPVTSRGAIADEFNATRSNVRATVAMARSGPNTATSQWYINMRDNTGLDTVDGGFTVFGRVTAPGMVVAGRIAALPRVNAGSPLNELPVYNLTGNTVTRQNVVLISEVTEFPATQSVSDRIFNYLEASFPQYASPSKATTGAALGYQYRYYSGTGVHVGTKDNQVWYLIPAIGPDAQTLGSIDQWFAEAQAAGY